MERIRKKNVSGGNYGQQTVSGDNCWLDWCPHLLVDCRFVPPRIDLYILAVLLYNLVKKLGGWRWEIVFFVTPKYQPFQYVSDPEAKYIFLKIHRNQILPGFPSGWEKKLQHTFKQHQYSRWLLIPEFGALIT